MRQKPRSSRTQVLTFGLVLGMLGPVGSTSSARASTTATGSAPLEQIWQQEHGFSIGLQIQTDRIGAVSPDPGSESDPNSLFFDEIGAGGLLNLGYAFTPAFGLRLSIGSARHQTSQEFVEAQHSSAVLEAHWRFLPTERARPYLFGGLGANAIRVDTGGFDVETSGAVAVFGFGLLVSVTHHLAIDFNGRIDQVNWERIKVSRVLSDGSTLELEDPVDASGSAGKFHLGLVWGF